MDGQHSGGSKSNSSDSEPLPIFAFMPDGLMEPDGELEMAFDSSSEIYKFYWDNKNFQYGIVAGLSVYAVAQVVAASSIVSSLSADVATLVKLTRVILLAPLVLVLRILFKSDQDEKTDSNLLSSILKYLPWFVIGFILLSVLRSTEIITQGIGLDIRSIAKFLFVLSMIAIGLTVNIKEIVKVGPKVALTIMLIIIYMVILGIYSSNFI